MRYLRDIERIGNDPSFPWVFNSDRASTYTDRWVSLFTHSKGPLVGKPKVFTDYERFIYGNIYGWYHKETGNRRFRRSYEQVARKNAKSQDKAIQALYEMSAFGEQLAEVYVAAPLCLNTPLLTTRGWKTIGTVNVGDHVFNENGYPCPIDYLSPIVKRKTYKIIFDDGSIITATDNHLWTVEQLSSMGKGKTQKYKQKTLTTEQIKKRIRYGKAYANRIPISKMIDFDYKELPLDPYLLGIWLGDGKSDQGSICKDEKDIEIINEIKNRGYELSDYRDKTRQPHIMRPTIFGIRKYLRKLNLINNKHIPEIYLQSSIKQRIDLLHGLMDTDGTCSKTGECRYSSSNENIANDFYNLSLSLGLKSHLRESLDVNGNRTWLITFKAYKSFPVFKLKRKLERQVSLSSTQHLYRWIRDIVEIEPVPARCISVISDKHLFLAGRELIITHNTKKEQTRFVWAEASWLFQNSRSETVRNAFKCKYDRELLQVIIRHEKSGSFFSRLSKDDKKSGDGSNPHFVVLDEYHLHDSTEYYDLATSGMKLRLNPLLSIITTAGFNLNNPCYRVEYQYVCSILDPDNPIENDRYFVSICELDKNDTTETIEINGRKIEPGQPIDELKSIEAIQKTNPILSTCEIGLESIRNEIHESEGKPEKVRDLLTKTFNFWIQQREAGYMDLSRWKTCINKEYPVPTGKDHSPFCGIDLSSTIDLTSIAIIINLDGYHFVLSHSFMPEETIVRACKRDNVPYTLWRDDGYITATPGGEVDYHFVIEYILNLYKKYDWKKGEICYDKHLATWLKQELENENFTPVEISQSYTGLSLATKELRAKVYNRKVIHLGDPVLSWAMGNAVVRSGPSDNIMLDKSAARFRIDPVAALINGFVRAIANERVQKKKGRVFMV